MNNINESPHINANEEGKPSSVSVETTIITIEGGKNITGKDKEPKNRPYYYFVMGYTNLVCIAK